MSDVREENSVQRRRSARFSTSAHRSPEKSPQNEVQLEQEGQSDVENKDPDVNQIDLVEEKEERLENVEEEK
jgi:hypothetical protein